jgi:hypothetical protein
MKQRLDRINVRKQSGLLAAHSLLAMFKAEFETGIIQPVLTIKKIE